MKIAKRRKSVRKKDESVKGDCPFCGRSVDFLWTCPCGFHMCQDCMNENLWGLTCNNITWYCPDCGGERSY